MSKFYKYLGNYKPLSIIAGPCVYESYELAKRIASELAETCDKYGVNFCYKTSFDKANRTSHSGYRGRGLDAAMEAFMHLQAELNIEILTDVHDNWQAEVINADILQIPAFLCRQTDLIETAAKTGKPVNVKKGQFLSPWEMQKVVDKVVHFGNNRVIQTERGTTFGYNNLVVDMRALEIMKYGGDPVIIDCTHAVQHPGGSGDSSGGDSSFAPTIAKSAVANCIAGVFMEVHPDPMSSPSDGPNMIRLDAFEDLLQTLLRIDGAVKQ